MASPPRRPLIEEVQTQDHDHDHDHAGGTAAAGSEGDDAEEAASPAPIPAAARTAGPSRAEFLEVGVTSRPQGHSLDLRGGASRPFAAPVPPSALFAKLDKFLPQIAKANEELAQNPGAGTALEISRVDDDDDDDDDEADEDDADETAVQEIPVPDPAAQERETSDEASDGKEEVERGVTMNITLVPLEAGAGEESRGAPDDKALAKKQDDGA